MLDKRVCGMLIRGCWYVEDILIPDDDKYLM